MTIKERLSNLFFQKASEARKVSSFTVTGQAQATPANYENFSKKGYANNVLVYKCVHMIATACAGIEWEVYSKRKMGQAKPVELENHPLLLLLEKPNAMQGQAKFIEAVIAYYLLAGNTYIESVKGFENQPPTELWPVRPDRMKIIPGADGYPLFFEFTANGRSKRWHVDQIKLTSAIMHIKTFNPTNDWYGLSPLEAAMLSLDQSNSANVWNLSMLKNSATPSGVLQITESKANPRGEISENQYGRLRSEFEDAYAGSKNAGRPLILEGGLEWKQISLSPKDMDFLKSKEVSGVEIATVFGVPPEMLGLGVKTYNNYKEARQAFYEDTVLPLMDVIRDELNRWLSPQFGEVELDYDKDDIEALVEKRESKYTSLANVNWLTINEKRKATGQDEVEGGDIFLINNQAVEDLSTLIVEPADETTDMNPDGTPKVPESNDIDPEDDPTKPPKVPEKDEEKGWKSFNLVNRNDRLKNYKKQNARRESLAKSFKTDLDKAFTKMNAELADSAKGVDLRLVEYAMLHQLAESMGGIKSVMELHIKRTLNEFGFMIFHEAKGLGLNIETKANTRKYESFVESFVKRRTGQAITQIEGTTKKKIHQVTKRLVENAIIDGDSNPELASDLRKEFDSLTNSRSQLIARTEVAAASNNGSMEAVKALDIPGMLKEWVAVDDDRTRDGDHGGADHLAMDGKTALIDEPFTVPPDASMDCPGDSAGGADQVCNCRCTLVYKLAKNGDE